MQKSLEESKVQLRTKAGQIHKLELRVAELEGIIDQLERENKELRRKKGVIITTGRK
jgi:hypothetical protein